MAKQSNPTAADALAFLVIECNVPLPYEVAENLILESPLYQALLKAWKAKNRRTQEGHAFLASCIYRAAGVDAKPSDFLPKTMADREEEQRQLRANFEAFHVARGGTLPK